MRPPRSPSDPLRALRAGAAILALAGVVLLVVTTFAAIVRIRIGSATDPVLATGTADSSGWDRHGMALLLLAAVAVPLALAALRGTRAAGLALAAVGLTVLGIALLADLPDLHDVGDLSLLYADSAAGPGPGWYTETAAAVTLLLSGITLALLAPGSVQRRLSTSSA
ncbi:MAG TPA: hypothetical protein VLB47_08995 [Solirubrobacteraceae bacterium]|nr:hypothetical protein [Solirubrobacteraceae bacterium]